MENLKIELLNIKDEIIKFNDIKDIIIQFKSVRRGRARIDSRKITIPIWTLQRTKSYAIYYVIHELSHFIVSDKFGAFGHGGIFKKIEIMILKKYNIIPIYKKAYPKTLTDLNGNILCGRYGKSLDEPLTSDKKCDIL